MKYLFLVYRDQEHWNGMSIEAREALRGACLAGVQDLRHSGRLYVEQSLHSAGEVMTVRVLDGDLSIREGPGVGMQGFLSELFIIQARDLNEAIQVAAKMPQARMGPIEVRTASETDWQEPGLAAH